MDPNISDEEKPTLIYLADLVHNYTGRGPFMFPINIGDITTFVNAHINKNKNIIFKLFKYPEPLLNEIENHPPNILGLGNYTWNADINDKVSQFAKSKDTITVMGGPNIHQYQEALNEFFEKRPFVDFYVVNEGEIGFLNLLLRYFFANRDLEHMKKSPIEGVVFYNNYKKIAIKGSRCPEIIDLDIIPSPYLEGVLDEFFEDNHIPNIETNRGCPYKCTYCDWGTLFQKMSKYSLDRLEREFEYIASKIKNTNMLNISDANFGIFGERDYEISKMLKSINERTGYPRKVIQAWAKNKSMEIIRIAETLRDLTSVTASFQSLDPIVLKAIKRNNISVEMSKDIINHFNENNIETETELILGLSEQTKESHLNDLRIVAELYIGQIVCYNCRMLEGAEMALPSEREKYGVKVKYRLVDQGFGKYKDFLSFEAEEMVKSTNAMSEEDILFFRPLHWLIYYVWNHKYHYELIRYLRSFNINLIDFLISVMDSIKEAPKKIQELMEEFNHDSRSEWFNSVNELVEHYSRPEIFKDICEGGFGKLNFKYIFKILIECSTEFDQYIKYIAKKMMPEEMYKEEELNEIIKFEKLLRINFGDINLDKEFSIEKERYGEFNYDILKWKKDNYKKNLRDYYVEVPIKYLFYMPDDQLYAISNNINQFKNKNLNLTLRKMSELMRTSDLFYKIRPLDQMNINNIPIQRMVLIKDL